MTWTSKEIRNPLQISLPTLSEFKRITLFYYKNNFVRTKALIVAKNLRTSSEQSQACCSTEHKSKVSRLAILKIIRTKHQNRTWLSFIFYCM